MERAGLCERVDCQDEDDEGGHDGGVSEGSERGQVQIHCAELRGDDEQSEPCDDVAVGPRWRWGYRVDLGTQVSPPPAHFAECLLLPTKKTHADEIQHDSYISGATSPGVTLQGTLMNHTSTASSVSFQLANWSPVLAESQLPFIFGEANSLYNEGAPGLSNSFGAALWVLDFALYCASNNVSRWHAHQGTNYRYAAWQPVTTEKGEVGTKAPYYGSVAAASFLAGSAKENLQVTEIELDSDIDPVHNVAYASYVNGQLARIAVLQMNDYNSSTGTFTQADGSVGTGARPTQSFTFQIPGAKYASGGQKVKVQRLIAEGSDAVSGTTFGGVSYDYGLGRGKPVVVKSVTNGVQMVQVASGGMLQIEVPFSSAAIVELL